MKKNIPRWPKQLPPPISAEMKGKLICLSPDDLQSDEDISQLVTEIYWYPDDFYYLFTKVNKGFGDFLATRFKQSGLILKKIERCFYPHPNPGYKNDFVHLPPGEIVYNWHKEAVKKQEYTRFTIELAPWKRKELDMAYTAQATVNAAGRNAPIVEAKPGFMGFSINLFAISGKLKRWWNGRKA